MDAGRGSFDLEPANGPATMLRRPEQKSSALRVLAVPPSVQRATARLRRRSSKESVGGGGSLPLLPPPSSRARPVTADTTHVVPDSQQTIDSAAPCTGRKRPLSAGSAAARKPKDASLPAFQTAAQPSGWPPAGPLPLDRPSVRSASVMSAWRHRSDSPHTQPAAPLPLPSETLRRCTSADGSHLMQVGSASRAASFWRRRSDDWRTDKVDSAVLCSTRCHRGCSLFNAQGGMEPAEAGWNLLKITAKVTSRWKAVSKPPLPAPKVPPQGQCTELFFSASN